MVYRSRSVSGCKYSTLLLSLLRGLLGELPLEGDPIWGEDCTRGRGRGTGSTDREGSGGVLGGDRTDLGGTGGGEGSERADVGRKRMSWPDPIQDFPETESNPPRRIRSRTVHSSSSKSGWATVSRIVELLRMYCLA